LTFLLSCIKAQRACWVLGKLLCNQEMFLLERLEIILQRRRNMAVALG